MRTNLKNLNAHRKIIRISSLIIGMGISTSLLANTLNNISLPKVTTDSSITILLVSLVFGLFFIIINNVKFKIILDEVIMLIGVLTALFLFI